ncbi:MAG: endonuclease/exonuclease/phosphatase family protein [Anaeromyxobacteraceae bacterium]
MRTRFPHALWFATACAMLAACGGDDTQRPGQLTVMTRNLYLGADLTPALAATDPAGLVAATTAIWASVQANDFKDRAKGIAAEIAAARPDLVALQEVALWRTQTPSDANPTPDATTVAYDFLALVRAELQTLGVTYDVAEELPLTDLEVPIATGPGTFDDVRFTDRDVILARSGVAVAGAEGHVYAALLTVPLPAGAAVTVKRGWTRVAATVAGQPVTFVNTHLESGDLAPIAAIRTAQAGELFAAVAPEQGRVVVAGDLNSLPGTEGHLAATTAGFADAWATLHGADPGFTCCFAADLRPATGSLSQRIDLVLTRGALRATSATIVGEEAQDRTPGGRWPSDHAGLVAAVQLQ